MLFAFFPWQELRKLDCNMLKNYMQKINATQRCWKKSIS